MRMMAMMITQTLRLRKKAIQSFWRRLILSFHINNGGMTRTEDVSDHVERAMVNSLIRCVIMSRHIVVASTAKVLLK